MLIVILIVFYYLNILVIKFLPKKTVYGGESLVDNF